MTPTQLAIVAINSPLLAQLTALGPEYFSVTENPSTGDKNLWGVTIQSLQKFAGFDSLQIRIAVYHGALSFTTHGIRSFFATDCMDTHYWLNFPNADREIVIWEIRQAVFKLPEPPAEVNILHLDQPEPEPAVKPDLMEDIEDFPFGR